MAIYTRMLRQKCVYWPPIISDEDGRQTYGTAVVIKCRWQDKIEQDVAGDSRAERSRAFVYLASDVEVDGVLQFSGHKKNVPDATILAALVSLTEPFLNPNAWVIQAFGKLPNMKATKFLRKATL